MLPKLRLVQICAIENLSPHMRRIVFCGDDLKNFPADYETAHVKVLVPRPGETMPRLSFSLTTRRRMRSYTVRSFDKARHRLTIDFAVNDHDGIVTNWAAEAKVGDFISIAGPGKPKYTDLKADWHLFIGDLTALPAIAATLEKLPDDANGYALLQVPSIEDQQAIELPANIDVRWIINSNPSRNELLQQLKTIDHLDGVPAIFIAGETSQVTAIRHHVKQNLNYQKSKAYISGYWRA